MADAALQAGSYLKRQLEQTIGKLYEKRFPSKWAAEGQYFPAKGNLEAGATSVIEEIIRETGSATILADGSNDIPVSDALIDEFPFKAVCMGTYFRYSVMELNAASKSGRDIRTARMISAKRRLVEREHNLAVFGSKKHDMQGYFSGKNIPLNPSSYDPNTATFQDHIDFIADNMLKVEDDSNQVEGVRTIMVPAKLRNIWAKAILPNTGITVLKHVMDTFGSTSGGTLQRIVKINECRSNDLEENGVNNPGDDLDLIVFSPDDEEAIERRFYGMQMLEPQLFGLEWRVYMYSATSEMIDHYPNSCLYSKIPKVA